MFTMKKITFLCVSAFLFAACSKAAPDNSEKKQENATNIEYNVQNTNINNGNENNSNIPNKPSENSNTLKTFKTEKQDAQLPLHNQAITKEQNRFLAYIPENAHIALVSTRKVSDKLAYQLTQKLRAQKTQQQYKRLGLKTPQRDEAQDDYETMFQEWGLPLGHTDFIFYADDNAGVMIYQVENHVKTQEKFKQTLESIKMMLPIYGLEWDGTAKTKANVTSYQFQKTSKPSKKRQNQAVLPVTVWTRFEEGVAYVVFSQNSKLNVANYMQMAKKPVALKQIGKISDESYLTGFVRNAKMFDLIEKASSFSTLGLLGMPKLPDGQGCQKDFQRLFDIIPTTTLDFRVNETASGIQLGVVFADEQIRSELQKLKTTAQSLTSSDDQAHFKLQLNTAQLYAMLSQAAKQVLEAPLECQALSSVNQFAKDLPELFSSAKSKQLIESFSGASIVLKDSTITETDMAISYAAHIGMAHAEQNVPTLMHLIGTNKRRKSADLSELKKDVVQQMAFPIDLPLASLPDGNALLTNQGYYIASTDYDIRQVASVQATESSYLAEIFVTDKGLQTLMGSTRAALQASHKKRQERMKRMNEERKAQGKEPLPEFPETPALQTPDVSLGFENLRAQVGVMDNGVSVFVQFTP